MSDDRTQNRRAPRDDRRIAKRGRNEMRELLRSRAVLTLLAATATVQGTALAVRQEARAEAAVPAAASLTVKVADVPRATTVATLRISAGRARSSEAAAPAKSKSGAARIETKATRSDVLAARYRNKGYTVPASLASQIHRAAVETGIDPKIAFGLVRTESSFKNTATSYVGAVGLTQLMPATARWLEPGTTRSDLRNPETNLRIGFRYLNKLIAKYDGNTELALTAYNRGPGTVDRVLRRGGNPDNGYAAMVLGR